MIYLLALFASRSIVLLILPLLLSLLVILGYAIKRLKQRVKTEIDYQDSLPKFHDFNSDPDRREVEEENVHQVTTL